MSTRWDDSEWHFRHTLANVVFEKSVRSRALKCTPCIEIYFYLCIIDSDMRISNIAEIVTGQVTFARHEWKIVKRATKSMIIQASRTRDVYSYSDSEIRIRDSTCVVGTRDRFSRYFNVGSVLCVVMSSAKRVQEEDSSVIFYVHLANLMRSQNMSLTYECMYFKLHKIKIDKLIQFCFSFQRFKELVRESPFKILIFF